MTTLADQLFTSSIPGGFATVQSNGGAALTATYNSAESSADLVPGAAWQAWSLDAVSPQASLSVELDVEAIDFPAGAAVGVALVPGVASVGGVYFRLQDSIYAPGFMGTNVWTPSVSLGDLPVGGQALTAMGVRRCVLRVETYLVSGARRLVVYRDGALVHVASSSQVANLRPAILLNIGSFRIRHVLVTDSPTNVESDYHVLNYLTSQGARLISAKVGSKGAAVPSFAVFLRNAKLGRVNLFQSGGGRITGTTEEMTVSTNLPYGARVRLYADLTGALVDEQFTDSLTGVYAFENLDRAYRYTVLAIDPEHNYRAVVADNVTPS